MKERSRAVSHPARILIVDADGRVRRGLRALIETQPDMVVIGEAKDSATALEYARRLHPTVIVLDLMLPTAQAGLDTVRRAARHREACVATSWQSGLRDLALQMGARGFLEKGAPPACLLAAIRAALQAPAGRATGRSRSASTPVHDCPL